MLWLVIGVNALLALALTVAVYGVFYFFVVHIQRRWVNPFRATPTIPEAIARHTAELLRQELEQLEADVEAQKLPQRRQAAAQNNGRLPERSPIDRGIVVNTSAIAADEANQLLGDCWLCDGRPLILGFVQITLGLLPCAILLLTGGRSIDMTLIVTGGTWAVVTALLFLAGGRTITENFRGGVKRWDRQLDGYLAPGFQIIVPILEHMQDVPLQVAEWGAHSDEPELPSEFHHHVHGTAGTGNPEPGVFEVLFLGIWPLEASFGVNLNVTKSDKAGWYWYHNQYTSLNQVGETIARYMLGVITFWVREMPWRLLEQKEREKERARRERAGEVTTDIRIDRQQILKDPHMVIEAYHDLLNQVPESVAQIMADLHGIGLQDLGGFLIRRVVLSVIRPGREYQDMLQSTSRAEVQRYVEQQLGKAAAARWEEFHTFLSREVKSEADRALLITMARQELDRVLYQNVGPEGANMLTAFLADLMSAEQSALRRRPGAQTPPPPTPPTT